MCSLLLGKKKFFLWLRNHNSSGTTLHHVPFSSKTPETRYCCKIVMLISSDCVQFCSTSSLFPTHKYILDQWRNGGVRGAKLTFTLRFTGKKRKTKVEAKWKLLWEAFPTAEVFCRGFSIMFAGSPHPSSSKPTSGTSPSPGGGVMSLRCRRWWLRSMVMTISEVEVTKLNHSTKR